MRTMMRRMCIEALYRRPMTSKPRPSYEIDTYLLRGFDGDFHHQGQYLSFIRLILNVQVGLRPSSITIGIILETAY
jgi:hypothetical protein